MGKEYLIVVCMFALLLSSCASVQDKPVNDDLADVSVSGDVIVSAVERKGF